jgi:hypothetical protein
MAVAVTMTATTREKVPGEHGKYRYRNRVPVPEITHLYEIEASPCPQEPPTIFYYKLVP